ncbi:hypothetical protein EON65_33255 [archaeon]|nr:MAG: hypothetical protein EON65_33255 [archaeon]
MGKAGKDRKRKRLLDEAGQATINASDDEITNAISDEAISSTICTLKALSHDVSVFKSSECKPFRAAIQPLVVEQADKHFEKRAFALSENEISNALSVSSMSIAQHTLISLSKDLEVFRSKRLKALRAALHPLVLELTSKNKMSTNSTIASAANRPIVGGFSSRISAHFLANAWFEALQELNAMRIARQTPKLGSLQRWIRDADLAPVELRYPLIEAILRVVTVASGKMREVTDRTSSADNYQDHAQPEHLPLFHIFPADKEIALTVLDRTALFNREVIPREAIKIVQTVGASDRPSNTDLNMYTLTPDTFVLDNEHHGVDRVDVSGVPGCFALRNVLSADECDMWLGIANMMGFAPDAVVGINHVLWLAEDKLVQSLFQRVQALLPQEIEGGALTGLNARLRFFRYEAGAQYRIHIDGAWPGSGFDKDGQPVEDIYGDRYSRLTFLVYLNDDFEGGCTTFYMPKQNEVMTLCAICYVVYLL